MKVKVEKNGPCRKTLVVELPAEEVQAEYRKTCDDFARVARIPGFRPGRAPLNLVQSHFAKAIREEIKERLIGRTYPAALKQAEIKPLMILDLQAELADEKPLVYRLVLDVPPEFKLPKYKHIPITVRPVEISAQDEQNALQRFLERLATTTPVADRPLRKGDLAQIDYVRKTAAGAPPPAGGKKNDPLAEGRNFWLTVGEDDFFLPGLAEALIGLAVGAGKEAALKLPADFKIRELAGKEVIYAVRVKAARARQLPVMNEEFFKAVGVPSEAELRARLKAGLSAEGHRLEQQRQRDEIINYLLSRTSLDLPESLVQEEARHMYAAFVRERLQRGANREQLEAQKNELLTAAAKSAGEKVKLGYILHQIGEEEKITVADSEAEAAVQELARRYRVPADELKKELAEKDELDSIRYEIKMDKTLDFLQAQAAAGAEEKGLISKLFSKKEEARSVMPQSGG